MALLGKLLVANRGEIALRIVKSAKQLGIRTVAVYNQSGQDAEYVRIADEKVSVNNEDLTTTFLDIDRIINIAMETGSSAIHPGYGFLSENPEFARACEEHQITFIGPGSKVLTLMGNKPEAKKVAASLGVPVAASYRIDKPGKLPRNQINFPVILKASYGGGGKGMKIVFSQEELDFQVKQSSRMALKYFGDGALFAEQYIQNARHVEVQVIGDRSGNILHLHERECSVQRNHQKIVEEAPAIFLSPELREKLFSAALKIAKAVNYEGAGTVEFLVDESGKYFFMEMNPRIQVEHAVTEQVTGIDIVAEQLKIASGLPLSFSQEEVILLGHAIEARVYAENPVKNFHPSPLPLLAVNLPVHQDMRVETDLESLYQPNTRYDPLLIKLIARGKDRGAAIDLLRSGLGNLNIIGPETNSKYLEAILDHDQYRQNAVTVEFCHSCRQELISYAEEKPDPALLPYFLGLAITRYYLERETKTDSDPWKYTGYWRLAPQTVAFSVDGQTHRIKLNINDKSKLSFDLNGKTTGFEANSESKTSTIVKIGQVAREIFYSDDDSGELLVSLDNLQHRLSLPGRLINHPEAGNRSEIPDQKDSSEIISHLHGKILEIYINENQLIKKGDPLLVIEAMKSENFILSHKDARVKKIAVKVGAQVTDRMPLIFLED